MTVLADLKHKLHAQVKDVHAFIAAWFRGDVENERSQFDANLASKWAEGMINIQPSGRALSREELVSGIFEGYGTNPAFGITIRDFRLLHVSERNDIAAATYTEHQRGAKNTTPPDNVRVSTVVFQVPASDEEPVWLHIHETAVPASTD